MKRIFAFSAFCIALSFALPLLLVPAHAGESDAPEQGGEQLSEARESAAPDMKSAVYDADMQLSVLTNGETVEMSMAEYLPMALAGEMPASFEPEALKAQAVALRTYALYCAKNRKSTHAGADVCAEAGCCCACADESALRESWKDGFETYYAKIRDAVLETDGQYLVYESEPILAAFHSSSFGQTESSADIWSARPYLVSVSSPETETEVTNLVTSVELTAQELRRAVMSAAPDCELSDNPEGWLGEIRRFDSGRVKSVELGGVELSGTAVRAMLSLRSTDFDIDYSGGVFVFTVRGYGHGVGMSQYGANIMAGTGAGYAEILEHYYPGAELVRSVRI